MVHVASYTILSYVVISKYIQYTSVRYIAPYNQEFKEIKVMAILIFQSKRHHNQALTINGYMCLCIKIVDN